MKHKFFLLVISGLMNWHSTCSAFKGVNANYNFQRQTPEYKYPKLIRIQKFTADKLKEIGHFISQRLFDHEGLKNIDCPTKTPAAEPQAKQTTGDIATSAHFLDPRHFSKSTGKKTNTSPTQPTKGNWEEIARCRKIREQKQREDIEKKIQKKLNLSEAQIDNMEQTIVKELEEMKNMPVCYDGYHLGNPSLINLSITRFQEIISKMMCIYKTIHSKQNFLFSLNIITTNTNNLTNLQNILQKRLCFTKNDNEIPDFQALRDLVSSLLKENQALLSTLLEKISHQN